MSHTESDVVYLRRVYLHVPALDPAVVTGRGPRICRASREGPFQAARCEPYPKVPDTESGHVSGANGTDR